MGFGPIHHQTDGWNPINHGMETLSGWWFGTWLLRLSIGKFIIPTDELRFLRGVAQPPTLYNGLVGCCRSSHWRPAVGRESAESALQRPLGKRAIPGTHEACEVACGCYTWCSWVYDITFNYCSVICLYIYIYIHPSNTNCNCTPQITCGNVETSDWSRPTSVNCRTPVRVFR